MLHGFFTSKTYQKRLKNKSKCKMPHTLAQKSFWNENKSLISDQANERSHVNKKLSMHEINDFMKISPLIRQFGKKVKSEKSPYCNDDNDYARWFQNKMLPFAACNLYWKDVASVVWKPHRFPNGRGLIVYKLGRSSNQSIHRWILWNN